MFTNCFWYLVLVYFEILRNCSIESSIHIFTAYEIMSSLAHSYVICKSKFTWTIHLKFFSEININFTWNSSAHLLHKIILSSAITCIFVVFDRWSKHSLPLFDNRFFPEPIVFSSNLFLTEIFSNSSFKKWIICEIQSTRKLQDTHGCICTKGVFCMIDISLLSWFTFSKCPNSWRVCSFLFVELTCHLSLGKNSLASIEVYLFQLLVSILQNMSF